MEKASDTVVLEDLMIGGLKVFQDTRFYRFTSDSVLLSKFATAKKGERVADFCSGSGIVALHFYALHPDLNAHYTLFEMQSPLAELSRRSIEYNRLENCFSVENKKIQEIGNEYAEKFSLVLCNPPYEKGGFEKEDYEKAVCRKEITVCLSDVAFAASKTLKFGGRLCVSFRADRVAELCYTLKKFDLEVKRLEFVSGKTGDKPYLVLAEAVKGGKPTCDVLPTLVNEK